MTSWNSEPDPQLETAEGAGCLLLVVMVAIVIIIALGGILASEGVIW